MGVDTIAKKALNRLTGHRSIPIQEAVHDIADLELVISSDYMTEFSIGKALFLRDKKNDAAYKKTDLIGSYRHRDRQHAALSLEQYFYKCFRKEGFYEDRDSKRKKYRILVPKGLQCKPCYPVTYEYARGMLVMHLPWDKDNPLDDILNDHDLTIRIFLRMVGNREFPLYVLAEYNRVVSYALRYRFECIAKEGKHSAEGFDVNDCDEDLQDTYVNWEHSCHISSGEGMKSNSTFNEMHGDIGLQHDWSMPFFKGIRATDTMDGCNYVNYLRQTFYDRESDEESGHVFIPRNKNGKPYKLTDLNDKQQVVVLSALDAMLKFLTNDPDYIPFRATVVGCGGTGKSHIINTMIALVREITQRNDTIKVAAPSGGAAYNVQGCTLHRLLSLSVDPKTLCNDLSEEKCSELAQRLENLLMLIVDERSMISSGMLAATERNLRHCAFGQQNQSEPWGGVPVVIFFGDDHQLMPVKECGVIEGFGRRQGIKLPSTTRKSGNQQVHEEKGNNYFIEDLTQNVITLTENYRTAKDPMFGNILSRLRVGACTESDADILLKRSLAKFNPQDRAIIENHPKTLWLFTRNWEKNRKNVEKLVELSNRDKVPIARLRCQWHTNRCYSTGKQTVTRRHFKQSNMVIHTDLCVGASVSLNGINIVPEAGLYNGARGVVVDIKYDTVAGPNDKHGDFLPKYIVVDFPGLRLGKAKPWDSNHPTVSWYRTNALIVLYNHFLYVIHCSSFSACSNTNDGDIMREKMLHCKVLSSGSSICLYSS